MYNTQYWKSLELKSYLIPTLTHHSNTSTAEYYHLGKLVLFLWKSRGMIFCNLQQNERLSHSLKVSPTSYLPPPQEVLFFIQSCT